MNCLRPPHPVSHEKHQRHKAIEKELENETKAQKANGKKLLILGPSESGKTTVLKQMKLLYDKTYTTEERKAYVPAIWANVVDSLCTILNAMSTSAMQLTNPENEQYKECLQSFITSSQPTTSSTRARTISQAIASSQFNIGGELPENVVHSILELCKDAGVRECFDKSKQIPDLNESAKHFIDQTDVLFSSNYIPTDQDILYARIVTTQISEHRIVMRNLTLRIFDVAGHKALRKKWVPYFDDSLAIIFVAAISAYDQQLREDKTVNRLHDALALFDEVINNKLLINTPVILFLNKIDLLKKKLATSPIQKYMLDYKGDNSYEDSCKYFAKKFLFINQNKSREIYTHFTWATDSSQIKKVFTSVIDLVVQLNLKKHNLL